MMIRLGVRIRYLRVLIVNSNTYVERSKNQKRISRTPSKDIFRTDLLMKTNLMHVNCHKKFPIKTTTLHSTRLNLMKSTTSNEISTVNKVKT
jgi:hypothetical protein